MKKLLILTFLISVSLFDQVIAMDEEFNGEEASKKKSFYHVVCTPSAQDDKLKEILTDPEKVIVGLNLEMGRNLNNSFLLYQPSLSYLKYLRLNFCDEKILSTLSKKFPQLEILDISGINLLELESLKHLNSILSLRVLDISRIHYSTKIPDILDGILSENKDLTLYIKSFRKGNPKQNISEIPDYSKNPQVILDKYNFEKDNVLSNDTKTIIY